MRRKRKPDFVVPMMVLLLCAGLSLPGCGETGEEAPAEPAATTAAASEPVETTVLHFDVSGMHCEGCANLLTSVVSRLDGVETCNVSYEDESAAVTVTDPALAETIIETITSAGEYTAELAEG
ncbi:MAG: heavy-metal-associated domain-containing protein [Planctomycetota bacterium]|nr:heavy-metal-associated domain-containing protein [Planctomycetota bacterium]